MSGWEFFDYDPVTGCTEYIAVEDGKIHFRTEQDVEPYINWAKFLANTGTCDMDRKHDMRLYAVIPPVVQAELFKKGISVLDQNDTKKLVKEINQNYPYLKTTTMHHEL